MAKYLSDWIRMAITMERFITDLLNRDVDPKSSQNHSSQSMMCIRDCRKNAAIRKELSNRLRQMLKENSSNFEEMTELFRKMVACVELEKRRRSMREVIALNRRRSILKKVWANRELPVDKESLQSVACKDVFDMSSLSESLPSTSGNNDMESRAERLIKEFQLFVELKRKAFIRSEIVRISFPKTCKLTTNIPCNSLKDGQRLLLNGVVEKVSGDGKKTCILLFKPLINTQNNSNSIKNSVALSCPELQELSINHKEETQNLDGKSKPENMQQIKEIVCKVGEKQIVLLLPQRPKMLGTRNDKQKNEVELNSKVENNIQNRKLLQHFGNQCPHKKHNPEALQLINRISLCRQLRRLEITNSRKETKVEHEIRKFFSNKNKPV